MKMQTEVIICVSNNFSFTKQNSETTIQVTTSVNEILFKRTRILEKYIARPNLQIIMHKNIQQSKTFP